MSQISDHILAPMLRKLELWCPLDDDERRALLGLPHVVRELNANQVLVWDGDRRHQACLIVSGFAYRHKVAGNGGRQILSVHMKGDLIDLQNSLLGVADHNVQMITAGTVAFMPVEAVREMAFRIPAIGMAMWYETLVEGSIFREWILNVGRRDAYTAIAHLLCEIALRMEVAGLGKADSYELPLTQDQLADAVGLTTVHVNRTLMRLEKEGHIRRTKRLITIDDWPSLAKLADFDSRYLHLHRTELPPGIPASLANREVRDELR
jgi:CRP-like cAMP-binding protein